MTIDCLIVGGGVIGLMTARELALAGCRVRVLERGGFGQESSWAGGGILAPVCPWRVPEALSGLAAWSQAEYPRLAAALQEDTGVDAEWTQSGMLWLDLESLGEAVDWARRHGVRCQVIEDPGALAAIEPACRPAARALWCPELAQIRNPRLVRALERDLALRGVELMPQRAVLGLDPAAGGGRAAVRLADGRLEADAVIVAAGAWSGSLLAPLGAGLDVAPVKGQMMLYQGPPGLLRRIVTDGERYAIPRRDGHVLVGSTLESQGFDKSLTAEAREALRNAAERLVPALASQTVVRQWAGLRPGAPQGIPYIGAVPGLAGLYVNAGHFRNGLLLAPASARLLADLVLGHAPLLDPLAFSPAR